MTTRALNLLQKVKFTELMNNNLTNDREDPTQINY